jgi:hypothetical protein
VELAPAYATFYQPLATVPSLQGKLKEAVEVWTTALGKTTSPVERQEIRRLMAVSFIQQKDFCRARECLKEALDCEHPRPRFHAGLTLVEIEKDERSLDAALVRLEKMGQECKGKEYALVDIDRAEVQVLGGEKKNTPRRFKPWRHSGGSTPRIAKSEADLWNLSLLYSSAGNPKKSRETMELLRKEFPGSVYTHPILWEFLCSRVILKYAPVPVAVLLFLGALDYRVVQRHREDRSRMWKASKP